MVEKQRGPSALPYAVFTFNGSMTPRDFVVRLHEAVAVLRAKRGAVEAGLLQREETSNYEWTTEVAPDGNHPVRVRAHLRAQKPGRPRVLHLEPVSLRMVSSGGAGSAEPCLYCGRPARRGENYTVHLTPAGARGPEGCRTASAQWPDGDDDEVSRRWRATCQAAPDFRS